MTPDRFHRLRSVLDRRQPDLTVVLENVHKPHNLSAVLRTCDAVGVFEAHAWTPKGPVEANRAASSSAGKWVRLHCHDTIEGALEWVRNSGHQILAAHLGEGAVDFRQADFTRPTAILMGQEKDGVSAQAIAAADSLITIPMTGMVESLNVSVATALILFEAQRQRAEAGLYDHPSRLGADLYRRTLFEWAYPYFADLCRRRGAPYPALDEDGELLEDVPR